MAIGDYPQYYQPIIGYVFWRIQSGETAEVAMQRALLQPQFAGVDTAAIRQAAAYAEQLYAATLEARFAESVVPEQAVGAGLFPHVGPLAVLGVRVTMTIDLAGGGTREISVLVNAAANAPIANVIAAAQTWALANAATVWGSRYAMRGIAGSEVSQLSGVAWDNAPVVVGPG